MGGGVFCRYPSPLSELRSIDVLHRSPINRIYPEPHKSLKRGIGPLTCCRYLPVLYRIKMDVMAMPLESFSSRSVCSQNRRCHIPRSLFVLRLAERRSP